MAGEACSQVGVIAPLLGVIGSVQATETLKLITGEIEADRGEVVRAAGLVISEKEGRTRRLWFNPVPIQQIYDRWTSQYGSFWAERVTDVKGRVEARARKGRRKSA